MNVPICIDASLKSSIRIKNSPFNERDSHIERRNLWQNYVKYSE